MPQSKQHSRRDFRNKLLHNSLTCNCLLGICCSSLCTIWYSSMSKNNEKHHSAPMLQLLLRALPVLKQRAHESMPAQSDSCTAIPCATSHENKPPPVWNLPDYLLEAPSSSQQVLLRLLDCLHLTVQIRYKNMCFGHIIQWSGPD